MAEDKSFELMPYFMWKIKDISVLKLESPIFSVNDLKFRMLYSQGKKISTLFMIPEAGYQQSPVLSYDIKTSVSIIDPDKSFEDLYHIQKKTNHNSSGREVNHLIWEMENEILDNLDMVQEENGKKNVTFLCVFGPFCEYQKDVAVYENPWCEFHCMERLGEDLDKLRLNEDSSSQLKCGDKRLNVHEVILSARSKPLANILLKKKATGKEVEIEDMELEVLENVINYIYTGRLKDSRPSVKLLRQLYKAANDYEIESLKLMTSFRLTEILISTELPGGQEVLDKEELPSSPYTMNKANLSRLTLELLETADEYKDASFKKSVILSIVHENYFILYEKEWKILREKNLKLAMEVYDVLVNELL